MKQQYMNEDGTLTLHDVFDDAVTQIKSPINQDELEQLLVDCGLWCEVKPGTIKNLMMQRHFSKKLIMIEGVRARLWVSNFIDETRLSKKIRFKSFIKEFLLDKTSILFKELTDILTKQGFTIDNWRNHFYYTDEVYEGQYKKVDGWILSGNGLDKIYKKTEVKELENDF